MYLICGQDNSLFIYRLWLATSEVAVVAQRQSWQFEEYPYLVNPASCQDPILGKPETEY